jgi:hypothetical protein
MANQAPTSAELAQQIANLTTITANLAQAIGTGGVGGAGGAGGAPSFATSPGVEPGSHISKGTQGQGKHDGMESRQSKHHSFHKQGRRQH